MTLAAEFATRKSVVGAMLFGSAARGDSDVFSDVDVVVFADLPNPPSLVELKRQLTRAVGHVSFSVYSAATARGMTTAGSLFLWHLKLEGRTLFQRDQWLDRLLADLSPYPLLRAQDDLLTLQTVLTDVQDSLRQGDLTLLFEAATLFTVLRNVGSVALAALGQHTFGRIAPIMTISRVMGDKFPISLEEISTLTMAKLMLVGKAPECDLQLDPQDLLAVSHRVNEVWRFTWRRLCAA